MAIPPKPGVYWVKLYTSTPGVLGEWRLLEYETNDSDGWWMRFGDEEDIPTSHVALIGPEVMPPDGQ